MKRFKTKKFLAALVLGSVIVFAGMTPVAETTNRELMIIL